MAGMITNAEPLLDDARNAFERPEVRFVPLGLRSLDQQGLQAAQVFVREPALAAGATHSPQTLAAVGLPKMEPSTGALATDAEPARYLGLRKALREESPRLDPTGLFCRVIHATVSIPFHAEDIPYSPSCVTSFCEDQ